jgi:hypothetical protein
MRLPGEDAEDWDKLMDQLDVEESVRATQLMDGSVQLIWTNQHCS